MKKTLKQWVYFLTKYLEFSLHPPCAPVPEEGRVSDQCSWYSEMQLILGAASLILCMSYHISKIPDVSQNTSFTLRTL